MTNHLEEAKELKSEFKIREALNSFELAYKEDENNPEIVANIGLCNMMMGNLEKSRSFFAKAIAINSSDELINLYITILDIATGTKTEIPRIEDENIEIAEQFMSASEMFYMIRLREEAFRLFEAILAEVSEDSWFNLVSNQYRIVTMLARFGFFIEAKEIAENLLKESEKTWHGYASFAQIELEQGNIETAKDWFKKAIQNGGDNDPMVIAAIADTRLLEVTGKEAKH